MDRNMGWCGTQRWQEPPRILCARGDNTAAAAIATCTLLLLAPAVHALLRHMPDTMSLSHALCVSCLPGICIVQHALLASDPCMC